MPNLVQILGVESVVVGIIAIDIGVMSLIGKSTDPFRHQKKGISDLIDGLCDLLLICMGIAFGCVAFTAFTQPH